MLALTTFQAMKRTENIFCLTGIGRGWAEAFPARGHQVIVAGRRQGLLERIRKFFAGFATRAAGRSDPATLPQAKTPSLSSVNTPTGPWVYTVVPWED
jgi:hypothetical protein